MDVGHLVNYIIAKIKTGAPPLPPGIKLGKNVGINRHVSLDWRFGKHITIGDGARIGHGAVIICNDSMGKPGSGLIKVAPVHIGARTSVGAYAVILPGVKIGDDAIIAAGAVVTKDVAAGDIVAGVPAKPIGRTEDLHNRLREDSKKTKCFESDIVYNDSKKIRDSIDAEQRGAIERDGRYYIIFNKSSKEDPDFD